MTNDSWYLSNGCYQSYVIFPIANFPTFSRQYIFLYDSPCAFCDLLSSVQYSFIWFLHVLHSLSGHFRGIGMCGFCNIATAPATLVLIAVTVGLHGRTGFLEWLMTRIEIARCSRTSFIPRTCNSWLLASWLQRHLMFIRLVLGVLTIMGWLAPVQKLYRSRLSVESCPVFLIVWQSFRKYVCVPFLPISR